MAQAKAVLKDYPTSPRKMRYVVDMVRGLDVEKAINILHFSTKHPARVVEKLLISAVNNWKQANEGMREEDSSLYVKTIFVDAGTTIKRFLPAPHGRAYKMRKRSNHVTIVVDSRVQPVNNDSVQDVEDVEAPVEAKSKPAKKTASKKITTSAASKKKAPKKTVKA